MLLSLKQTPSRIAPPSFHDAPRTTAPLASPGSHSHSKIASATKTTAYAGSSVTVKAPPAPSGAGSPPPLSPSPRAMSSHHRNLPLPAAMSLPAPPPSIQVPAAMTAAMSQSSTSQLPAPPAEWRNNTEDSMRSWLQARQEEDKRKQEEEKTRQEGLRLEQRRIEQSMLHESLQGGIPPYLIPMVFAGMGGGNLANVSVEWAQHYLSQAHQHLQGPGAHAALPQPQSSPDSRRDSRESRVVGSAQPSPYAPHQTSMPHASPAGPAPQPHPSPAGSSHQGTPFMSTYSMSPAARQGGPAPPHPPPPPPPPPPLVASHNMHPTSAPRPPAQAVLPRLTTGEIHIQPSPHGPAGVARPGPGGLQQMSAQAPPAPPSQVAPPPEPPQQSPSISFLHWQPPLGSKESKEPGTPGALNYFSTPDSSKDSVVVVVVVVVVEYVPRLLTRPRLHQLAKEAKGSGIASTGTATVWARKLYVAAPRPVGPSWTISVIGGGSRNVVVVVLEHGPPRTKNRPRPSTKRRLSTGRCASSTAEPVSCR